ncbi:MAG: hypothetical protein RBU29_08145 [bacterium]|jgi:hypothetical protein|nr:hypothetical protein [bacterium]
MTDHELWSAIEIVSDVETCEFCGQERLAASPMCQMCSKHMDGVVYGICRELLVVVGQMAKEALNKRTRTDRVDDAFEIAITKVLDDFPIRLSQRTHRFERARQTEGVWFAHMVAYLMIHYLRKDKKWPIQRMVLDEMYFYVREKVFDYLKRGHANCSSEDIEAVRHFYNIPEALLDGRRVIYAMMLDLEKRGRIKISRPRGSCAKCGTELTGQGPLCDECQEEASKDLRLAIAAGLIEPPPLLPPKGEESESGGGMHIRPKVED